MFMKKSTKIIYPFILVLLSMIGCPDTDPGGLIIESNAILMIDIENNSNESITYTSEVITLGSESLEENRNIIFESDEEYQVYLSHSLVEESDFNLEQDDEIVVEGNGEKSLKVPLYALSHDPESILIELDFGDDKVKYLAGWPKYYHELEDKDVVKYGFFYNFVNHDKKRWDRIDTDPDFSSNGFQSIDSDYDSGELTGYKHKSRVGLTITVNSIDDIQVELEQLESYADKPMDLPEVEEGVMF